MNHHLQKGILGETIAIEFLQRSKNYIILERNWRFSHAEIDIIAKDGDTLVFIEVKTRSNISFGRPEEFVSHKKMSLIQDAANEFMKTIQHEWAIRFDIVSIVLNSDGNYELEHFEDAWW